MFGIGPIRHIVVEERARAGKRLVTTAAGGPGQIDVLTIEEDVFVEALDGGPYLFGNQKTCSGNPITFHCLRMIEFGVLLWKLERFDQRSAAVALTHSNQVCETVAMQHAIGINSHIRIAATAERPFHYSIVGAAETVVSSVAQQIHMRGNLAPPQR